jgi:urease accessory protein
MNAKIARKIALPASLAALGVAITPGTACAHIGVDPIHDLMHGLQHPLTGIDHICAMIAVGIWAAQRGGRALWMVPLTFVSVMALGGALGMSGVSLPFVEQGIVLSVIILGVLIAVAVRLPLALSMAIVGLFALVHGHAHGTEIPATASGLAYALGFIAATIALHTAGITFGLATQRSTSSQLTRLAGAAIALCGIILAI